MSRLKYLKKPKSDKAVKNVFNFFYFEIKLHLSFEKGKPNLNLKLINSCVVIKPGPLYPNILDFTLIMTPSLVFSDWQRDNSYFRISNRWMPDWNLYTIRWFRRKQSSTIMTSDCGIYCFIFQNTIVKFFKCYWFKYFYSLECLQLNSLRLIAYKCNEKNNKYNNIKLYVHV